MPARQARRSAGVLPRRAARLVEKIEFNLLLADLAFQLGYAFSRQAKVLYPRGLGDRIQFYRAGHLERPPRKAKTFRPVSTILRAPHRQMAAADLELTAHRRTVSPASTR